MNRDQFVVVLASLRARCRAGVWGGGEPLTVAELAAESGVSATPVREALARLAGEGLVEDRRGRGYYARRIDGVDLADLYRVQLYLARVALSGPASGETGRSGWAPLAEQFLQNSVCAWEAFYERLIRRAASPYLMDEQRRLADHLAPARCCEPGVLAETRADFEGLCEAAAGADVTALAEVLEQFTNRRRAAADALVNAMRLHAGKYKPSI